MKECSELLPFPTPSSEKAPRRVRTVFAATALLCALSAVAGCGGSVGDGRGSVSKAPGLAVGDLPPHSPVAAVGSPEGTPVAGNPGSTQIAAASTTTRPQAESELQPPAVSPIDLPQIDGAVIALLAPLTGRHAKAGQSLLDGAQMALFDVRNPDVRLVPIDTRGTENGTRAATRKAIESGARIILGPLLANSVLAAKPVATPLGIPLIAFSNSVSVAGDGVYLAGFTPEQQVRTIVQDAIAEGRLNFAVLAPSNDYGEVAVSAMQRTLNEYGAVMTKLSFYDPGGTDFSGPIRQISNYDERHKALLEQRAELAENDDEASKLALKALENLDTVGDPPFDAILVPAISEQRLRIISAQLAFFDVDQPIVRVLGLQPWDNFGDLSKEPGLIGSRYPAPPSEQRAAFVQRYGQVYGYRPARLASLAYDVMALASGLAKQGDNADFSDAALTNPTGFFGAEGLFRFLPNGVAERGYAILEITQQGTRTLRPAPTTFTPAIN